MTWLCRKFQKIYKKTPGTNKQVQQGHRMQGQNTKLSASYIFQQ